MSKLRVHDLAMSLDGYVAGPNQSIDNPLGEGGTRLHEWVFATRTTFHFATDGIESALARAFEAAGGASTVRQFLRAGLIDTAK